MLKGKISGLIAIASVLTVMWAVQASAQANKCVGGKCEKPPEQKMPAGIPPAAFEFLNVNGGEVEAAVGAARLFAKYASGGEVLDFATIQAIESDNRKKEADSAVRDAAKYGLTQDTPLTRETLQTKVAAILEEGGYERLLGADKFAVLVAGHVRGFMAADADNDGRITADEVWQAVWAGADNQRRTQETRKLERLLTLDTDGDAKLTAEEARAVMQAAFRYVDANKDGTIDDSEKTTLRKYQNEAERAARGVLNSPRCALPPAEGGEKIFALRGGMGSDSGMDISGAGKVTGIIDVVIAPDAPLSYLVLSGSNAIWRISGDTSKLRHVAVLGFIGGHGKIAAGVMGVSADEVSFHEVRDCVPDHTDGDGYESAAEAALRDGLQQLLGRAPDGVLARGRAAGYGDAYLTAAGLSHKKKDAPAAMPAPQGFDAYMWEHLVVPYAGGRLEWVAAESVVSPAPARKYKIYPHVYGFAQLVHDGVLEYRDLKRVMLLVQGEKYPEPKMRLTEQEAAGYASEKVKLRQQEFDFFLRKDLDFVPMDLMPQVPVYIHVPRSMLMPITDFMDATTMCRHPDYAGDDVWVITRRCS